MKAGERQGFSKFGQDGSRGYGDRRQENRSGPYLLSERKLSIKQAAKEMGIGATTLRRLIKDGKIPVIRINGKTLVLERDIEAYLQRHYGSIVPVVTEPRPVAVPAALKHADVLVKAK